MTENQRSMGNGRRVDEEFGEEEARTGSTMNLDQIRFRITPPSYMSRTPCRDTS